MELKCTATVTGKHRSRAARGVCAACSLRGRGIFASSSATRPPTVPRASRELKITGQVHNSASWLLWPDYVAVTATVEATGETRAFVMPTDEVVGLDERDDAVVSNPEDYIEVTGIDEIGKLNPTMPSVVLRGADLGVSFESIPESRREKAEWELSARARFRDEFVSLQEHLESVGVLYKSRTFDINARRRSQAHFIALADGTQRRVLSATFEALIGVPDATSEADILEDKARAAIRRVDALQRSLPPAAYEEVIAARGRADAAHATASRVRVEQSRRDGWLPIAESVPLQREEFRRRLAQHHNLDIAPDNDPAWKWIEESGVDVIGDGLDDRMHSVVRTLFPNP